MIQGSRRSSTRVAHGKRSGRSLYGGCKIMKMAAQSTLPVMASTRRVLTAKFFPFLIFGSGVGRATCLVLFAVRTRRFCCLRNAFVHLFNSVSEQTAAMARGRWRANGGGRSSSGDGAGRLKAAAFRPDSEPSVRNSCSLRKSFFRFWDRETQGLDLQRGRV